MNDPAVSEELLSLTYGALVAQIVQDLEDVRDVNEHLDKIGYSLGCRAVDDYFVRKPEGRCRSFVETMRTIGTSAVPLFLGAAATVTFDETETSCALSFAGRPLAQFVELPSGLEDLQYSGVLAGAVRGALEMVGYKVETRLEADVVAPGATNTVVRVVLIERIADVAGEEYQDE